MDRRHAPRLSAAVAFYTLPTVAPGTVITVAVAAIVLRHGAAEGRLAAEIQGIVGPEVAWTIETIIAGLRGYIKTGQSGTPKTGPVIRRPWTIIVTARECIGRWLDEAILAVVQDSY